MSAPAWAQVLVTHGTRRYDDSAASRTVDSAFDGGGTDDADDPDGMYGCGTGALTYYLRPPRVFQVLTALRDHNGGRPLVHLGIWASTPPGSNAQTKPHYISDVSRLLAFERPDIRQVIDERADIITQWKGAAAGNYRSAPLANGGCPTGTLSADSRHAGACLARVPLCVGGPRDGKHAPLDPPNGYHTTNNPLCPDGTVIPTEFDLSWILRVSKDDHEARLPTNYQRPTDSNSFDLAWLCDGYTPSPAAGDGVCGTGYGSNFGGSAATAAANLPAHSMADGSPRTSARAGRRARWAHTTSPATR